MTCVFFGHRSVPREVEPLLRAVLVDLIERHGAGLFYVGCHGGFDSMAQRQLSALSGDYPGVTSLVVLSCLPAPGSGEDRAGAVVGMPTVVPDGIEAVPPRFAIPFCNRWMMRRADCVVAYAGPRVASGAAAWVKEAERRGKKVINLYGKE